MNNMFKRVFAFLMTLAVVFSCALPAFAADSTIIFKGKDKGFEFKPGSEYSDTDLFDNFKGVLPGDSLTEEITVTNVSDDSDFIKLYIRAEVADDETNPLSPGVADTGETVVSMLDFLSQLSMKVWNGDTSAEPIYDASPDELDGFADSVYLATLRKDETLTLNVQLDVPDDLDNKYQFRTGEVTWVFSAELFDDPTPPPTENTTVTVRKVWVDDGESRPSSVGVYLIRDGKYFDKKELSEANQWTYTWSKLDDSYRWSVEESEVPEGYNVSYMIEGNVFTIINTAEQSDDDIIPPPVGKTLLPVKKLWSGDEENLDDRPESVKITLYNGTQAVETVVLGDWNNWEYVWENLDGNGNWSVVEVDIPQGYVPTYSIENGVVTITNVSTLVQTGQVKWPIPFLAAIGFSMIVFGEIIVLRKRKNDNV